MRLVDADRCPYCARVRIALAEKGLEVETVQVDLSNRPDWLLELNPPNGRVPVLDGLPESEVIMELLEELHPDPPLLPPDPAQPGLADVPAERDHQQRGQDGHVRARRRRANH